MYEKFFTICCIVLITRATPAIGMAPSLEDARYLDPAQSAAHPFTPPTLTYGQYINDLLCEETIDGWGEATGNLASWLQRTANKRLLETPEKAPTLELPFFLLTLNPIVDNGRLRADYDFPCPGADLKNGPATLSLFHSATPEELALVGSLPQEPKSCMLTRLLQWQNQHYRIEARANAPTLSHARLSASESSDDYAAIADAADRAFAEAFSAASLSAAPDEVLDRRSRPSLGWYGVNIRRGTRDAQLQNSNLPPLGPGFYSWAA